MKLNGFWWQGVDQGDKTEWLWKWKKKKKKLVVVTNSRPQGHFTQNLPAGRLSQQCSINEAFMVCCMEAILSKRHTTTCKRDLKHQGVQFLVFFCGQDQKLLIIWTLFQMLSAWTCRAWTGIRSGVFFFFSPFVKDVLLSWWLWLELSAAAAIDYFCTVIEFSIDYFSSWW